MSSILEKAKAMAAEARAKAAEQKRINDVEEKERKAQDARFRKTLLECAKELDGIGTLKVKKPKASEKDVVAVLHDGKGIVGYFRMVTDSCDRYEKCELVEVTYSDHYALTKKPDVWSRRSYSDIWVSEGVKCHYANPVEIFKGALANFLVQQKYIK